MKKNILRLIAVAVVFMLALTGCTQNNESSQTKKEAGNSLLSGKCNVEIDMGDLGIIKAELDADVAPISVANFVKLAESGYYDGKTFHRVISGFMIQGGSSDGIGMKGSDETIKGEFSSNGIENNIKHVRGVLSMARANGADSASSQFFIVHQESDFLDGKYAGFGKVTEGMDVVDKICEITPTIDTNGSVVKENQPVIKSIKVIE